MGVLLNCKIRFMQAWHEGQVRVEQGGKITLFFKHHKDAVIFENYDAWKLTTSKNGDVENTEHNQGLPDYIAKLIIVVKDEKQAMMALLLKNDQDKNTIFNLLRPSIIADDTDTYTFFQDENESLEEDSE